jgi:hypothetical protein
VRILVATHQLFMGAGTETYVRTLASALADRGHEVFVYSPFLGGVSAEIAASGIPVTNDITSWRHEFFSVAHVHHNIIATQVRATLPGVPIVWLRHGIAPELERPPTFVPEVMLAIAPERARGFGADGPGPTAVVPNPIDTSFYAPTRAIRTRPQTAVVITNHLSAAAWASIEHACRKLDIRVRHVGHPNNSIGDVRETLAEADLVFGVGRSALEAGSMARAVLIHDHHGCDGWLDRSNYAAAAEFGFSGHRLWHLPSGDELAELIAHEYSPEKGQEAREVVVEHHALDVVVPELERHYRRAVQIGRATVPEAPAYAPSLAEQFGFYQQEIRALRAASGAEDRAVIESLRAQLDSVYSTRSWRLTAPLRQLIGVLRFRRR